MDMDRREREGGKGEGGREGVTIRSRFLEVVVLVHRIVNMQSRCNFSNQDNSAIKTKIILNYKLKN